MIRWTERTFTFDLPISMMPVILMRLRGTAPRLRYFVKNIPENILKQRIGDKWSIQEHIGHLLDLDELHDGRIDDYLKNLPVLRAADMKNKKTEDAHHNEKSVSELLNEFETARNKFLDHLQQLQPEQTSMHPRLEKPMRVIDMAFFVAEHDDHHIALMNETLNECRIKN